MGTSSTDTEHILIRIKVLSFCNYMLKQLSLLCYLLISKTKVLAFSRAIYTSSRVPPSRCGTDENRQHQSVQGAEVLILDEMVSLGQTEKQAYT